MASSALQLAVIRASSAARKNTTIVGNRGVHGDIVYEHSVLNDSRFIPDLERIIDGRDVEIYIPNSINLLYFFCAANKRVKRISFVDEGRLTKRHIEGGFRKPTAWYHRGLSQAMRLTLMLPGPLRKFCLKTITVFIRKFVVQKYEQDTLGYPYRTIERNTKPGIVLSHIRCADPQEWMEFVDITKNLDLPNDYSERACLFLHPKNAANPELIDRLQAGLKSGGWRLLIRPHPIFHRSQDLLDEVMGRIEASGIACEIASVTGKNDVAIELYARGVRTFFCGESSIIDTVDAYKGFFRNLRIVRI